MAANCDILHAETVKGLKLKSTSRYVAYALTDIVKGLKNVVDGDEVIVHQPFGVVRAKTVITNKISIVPPMKYLDRCTSEDPDEFVRKHIDSANYINSITAQTLQSLLFTGVMKHLCFYNVVTNINDGPGTTQYIIGHDFTGYEDMSSLPTDWFLFSQTTRVMDM